MTELSGATAFITGAAGGIGLGIARALAAEGMNIALADVDEAELANAAGAIGALGVRALPIRLDVRDRAQWAAAVAQATASFGPIRILCNNAGVTTYDPLAEMPEDNWDWIVAVNLTGVYNGIRAAVPGMIAAGAGGHVVNTASTAGLFPQKGMSIGAYAATKYGVVAMSETLRMELAPHGIGVSSLCPGLVETRIGQTSASERPVPAVRPRPAHLAKTANRGGADPAWVGERVLTGIRANQTIINTHPDVVADYDEYTAMIRADIIAGDPPRIH